jgi:GAF domain-containing protein
VNAWAPSWKAPRWVVRDSAFPSGLNATVNPHRGVALSLEPEPEHDIESGPNLSASTSTTVQYEFKSLTGDLTAALTLIASRACSITRGTGAAVALVEGTEILSARSPEEASHTPVMRCRAVAGSNVPPIGAAVNVSTGFTGACIRELRPLRCDDTEFDLRVDADACRRLGIASILAAPVIYERDLVGLVEVFSTVPFAFDDGDLAVVERLAQTVVLTLSKAEVFRQE